MLVKLGIISPNRDEKETYLSCHHLVTDYGSFTIAETASLGGLFSLFLTVASEGLSRDWNTGKITLKYSL